MGPIPTPSAIWATTTNQSTTVTANGCTGGVIKWTVLGGTSQASGNTYTLTQPGNYTLWATCSLNGYTSSSSAPLSVPIRPGGFAITGVTMVNGQLIDEVSIRYSLHPSIRDRTVIRSASQWSTNWWRRQIQVRIA